MSASNAKRAASPEPVLQGHSGLADDGRYFSGDVLIGEDFTPEEIAQWFDDEKEATTEIRGAKHAYGYHAINRFHGFSKLPDKPLGRVMSYGGGDGSELLPILPRAGELTVLEPSEGVQPAIPATYVRPNSNGSIPFPDGHFDLITCLSVLHHVPKVSTVIREFHRCTARGGHVFITEPVISMGDWRRPRPGLTRHERGIPLHLLRGFIKDAGFTVVVENRCCFAPLMFVNRKLGGDAYNSRALTFLDYVLSSMPFWSTKYHAQTWREKFRPMGIFFVLTK